MRSASASGVERDPGQTTASRTPAATSSSTKARRPAASLIARPPGCPGRDHRPQLDPRLLPLEVRVGVGDDAAAGEQRRVRPVHDPAAERHAQLAVAVGAQPADGPGVPAPVEALVLVDQRERHVARLAAHGRRRVEALAEREEAVRLGHGPGDLRDQVLDEAQRQDPGLRGHREAVGDRAQQVPDGRDDDGVLLAVLLGGEQGAAQPRVLGGIGPAADRAGDGDRAEGAALGADEALGGGAQERPTAAPEGVGRALGGAGREAPQGVGDVELHRGPQAHAAREHHLVDPAAPDGAGEHADQPAPVVMGGLLLDDGEGREHRQRDHAVGVGRQRAGAGRETLPAALEPPDVRGCDRSGQRAGKARAIGRHGQEQLREHQRAGPERTPRVVRGGHPPGEPERTEQDGAGIRAPPTRPGRCAHRPSPRATPPRPGGTGPDRRATGPGTSDAHEGHPLPRAEPERDLEVRLDRRGDERDRVDRRGRHRRGDQRGVGGTRVQQPGQPLAQARRHVPGAGEAPPGLDGRTAVIGAGSGKSQPSGGSGTSPMRSAGHAGAPQQGRPQRRVGVLQAARLVGQQPAPDDLVERPEPGDARDPRVDRRARAGGDRLVEVALDQPREALVERVRLRLEDAPGADRVEEQQPGHRPVAGERGEHRVDRRLGPRDRLRLQRDRPLHLGRRACRRSSASARGRSLPWSGSGSRRRPWTSPRRRRCRRRPCRGSRAWRTCENAASRIRSRRLRLCSAGSGLAMRLVSSLVPTDRSVGSSSTS